MSIRIEVTGDSLPEVADKLLALAAQFGATRSCGYDHTPNAETIAAMQELQDARPKSRKSKKVEQEDTGNSAKPDTEASSAPGTTPDVGEQTSDGGQTAQADASPSEAPTLDFDKEVAPVVIEAVQRVGKPSVSAALSEFGVERASEVDPALYGELVAALKAL